MRSEDPAHASHVHPFVDATAGGDTMGKFQHPHLTRGIVRTEKGAFEISRGLVDVPDELGESLGWRSAEPENATPANASGSSSPSSGTQVTQRRRKRA